MRKRFIGFLIIFLLFAGAALAEGQVDPDRPQMLESLKQKQQIREEYLLPESGGAPDRTKDLSIGTGVNISISGSKLPTKELTFTASVPGASDAKKLEYYWGISDEGRDSNGYLYYPQHASDNLKGKTRIKYRFYSAGTYSVFLIVRRGGTMIGFRYMEFTVKDDGNHPTLEQKAQQIVNECKASTKWETALNLHDWLTNNAYYDESLNMHGADILFLGYGVCDSYSKAYELLCNTAGIPVERTFGPNHAWNTVKLDGKWYQVDATWDDPGSSMPGEGTAASGYEGHQFFCLSAAAMIPVDSHSYSNGTQEGKHAADCTSMDANYFIHEGIWRSFGDLNGMYVSRIQNVFDGGGSFSETVPSYAFYVENGYTTYTIFYPSVIREILKTGLPKQQFTLGGETVKTKISVSKDLKLTARITGWKIDETGTLAIPGSLTSIPEQAFYHHAATRVILPKGCKEIGSKAFANSAVRAIEIPGPVTYIADDAFEGCQDVMFISNDKKVKVFAANHGFIVVDP